MAKLTRAQQNELEGLRELVDKLQTQVRGFEDLEAQRAAAKVEEAKNGVVTPICARCNGTGRFGHVGPCYACKGKSTVVCTTVHRVVRRAPLGRALAQTTNLPVKAQGDSVLINRGERWVKPTLAEIAAAEAAR